MLIPRLDRASAAPFYRQICDEIARLVDAGALAPGERLPPTRVLARALGLHRSTLVRAYAELWARGYLESRPGSYSTVRRRPRVITRGQTRPRPAVDYAARATPAARTTHETVRQLGARGRPTPTPERAPGLLDLSQLAPDPDLAPCRELRRCFTAALQGASELLDYGDPAGHAPLRAVIARRLRAHGVEVEPDDVVITNGAQQAIDLALRLLTRPGDPIAIEAPTYGTALALFRLHELALVETPMCASGMDLDVLAARIEKRRPALVYTIPSFHNPTGISTGQAHRERLLELCVSHRIPILEDGFEEELKYFGRAVLPIKSMDAQGVVLYVGTFSKVVFPGLRIGWIVAPPACAERLRSLQIACSISGNGPSQAALALFCERGGLERHLRRAHTTYRGRMVALLRSLSEHMPSAVEWTRPTGGYTLWLRLPASAGEEQVIERRLLDAGVRLAPGRAYFATPRRQACFRISVSSTPEDQIPRACRRIASVLRPLVKSRSGSA